MRFVITLIFAFAACIVNAQDILTELAKDFPGQGKVVINQSCSVAALVGCQTSTSSKDGKSIKTIGYRVQLYAGGNSRDARSEAYNIAEKAQKLYPDAPVHTIFQSPRWLCQFGDFRTIEEADAMMRELSTSGDFKNMVIVRSPIIIKIEE